MDFKVSLEDELRELSRKKDAGEFYDQARFDEIVNALNSISREENELRLEGLE